MKKAPIIELLQEETISEIKSQIEHLEKMAVQDDEKVRFQQMLAGAKTVFNIIENDSIGQRGTDNFLRQLDREQLTYAISSAKSILKNKTSIGKVKLFGVFGGKDDSFWSSDEKIAEDYYLVAAKESLNSNYPNVKFDRTLVPIEELPDFLSKEEIEVVMKKNAIFAC